MFSKDRSPRQDFVYDQTKQSIEEANKISIAELFKSYRVPLDSWNKKACCPLPDHSGGKERTPSFYYYDQTNSFYCFGCKAGGGPVDFISKLESITKYKASLLLLKGFNQSVESSERVEEDRRSIIEFSHIIRAFIKSKASQEATDFAERFAIAFDDIRYRRPLHESEYQKLIKNIMTKLNDFND